MPTAMLSGKFFSHTTLLAALVLVSCGQKEPAQPDNPPEVPASVKLLSSSSPTITLDASGGTATASFTASAAWTASVINNRADSWCTVSPTSGLAGTGTVSITVAANDSPDERSATVQVKCGAASCSIVVTQKQKDALTLTPSKNEFGAEGGTLEIVVSANVEYSCEVDATCKEWISHTGTKALNSKTWTFTVEKNEDAEKREGAILVKSALGEETIRIYQEGAQPSLVLTKNEYTVAASGETIQVEVKSNVDVSSRISDGCDWISEVSTKAISTNTYFFAVAANESPDSRSAEIVFYNETMNVSDTVRVSQLVDSDRLEREALIAFYNATGGPSWTNNTNWCSDKPIGEWYGVVVDANGRVTYLNLWENNLQGVIPSEIKYLTQLFALRCSQNPLLTGYSPDLYDLSRLYEVNFRHCGLSGNIPTQFTKMPSLRQLDLAFNHFSGTIPAELGTMSQLTRLYLSGNRLTGQIPPEIGNLTQLEYLDMSFNQLTGEIPESFNNLTHLERFPSLSENKLSGKVPEIFTHSPGWNDEWPWIMSGNLFSFEDNPVKAQTFSIVDLDGNSYTSEEVYPNHKLTALLNWGTWCGPSNSYIPLVKRAYEQYKDKGLWVLGQGIAETQENMRRYIANNGIIWPNFLPSETNRFDGHSEFSSSYGEGYPVAGMTPIITLIDSQGYMVFCSIISTYEKNLLLEFLNGYLGPPDTGARYVSTDFSQDKTVKQMLSAREGNGIDVVLMGDAFSDRMVASNEYGRMMSMMEEALFEKEPYKSFRHLFNVYSVTAVSVNEDYMEGNNTVFSTQYGEGTSISGDFEKIREYAELAIGAERVKHAMILVALNSYRMGGTCHRFSLPDNDFGDGMSIAYIPTLDQGAGFANIVRHEAGGHGLAKLADEYANEGSISEEEKQIWKEMDPYGWSKNIDFTSDPKTIKWARFISDERYSFEKIGVYSGGLGYISGVWRPSENSIMMNNDIEYNAPSREAIYYTIHKLAYGKDWEYNYEDFVAYDQAHRPTQNAQSSKRNFVEKRPSPEPAVMGAPPVFMGFLE